MGNQVRENEARSAVLLWHLSKAHSPILGHCCSWRSPSNLSTLRRSPGQRISCLSELCETKVPPLLGCWPHTAHVRRPWFVCAEVPSLRELSLKDGCWHGIWAWGQEFLALALVEKQETGRVVPPVHAKVRASGSFIRTLSKRAFDIYVSLRWSSVMRFHLKRSMWTPCPPMGALRPHSWAYSPPWSHEKWPVFSTSEKLLCAHSRWMEDRFWKGMPVLFVTA